MFYGQFDVVRDCGCWYKVSGVNTDSIIMVLKKPNNLLSHPSMIRNTEKVKQVFKFEIPLQICMQNIRRNLLVIDKSIIVNFCNIFNFISFILELNAILQEQPELDEFPFFYQLLWL